MDRPKWSRFEDLAAEIQKTLAPSASVTQNDRILGRHSGVQREIDIAIRKNIGQYKLLIVIDCKDYKQPVDVKDVEAFIGLVEDVGANKGAIIAAMGFTKTAKNRAKKAGIDLHRLIDTDTHEWKMYVTMPTLIDYRELKSFSPKFSWTGQCAIEYQDFRLMMIYQENGEPVDLLINLLSKRWEDGSLPIEAGRHGNISITKDQAFILSEGRMLPLNIKIEVLVVQHLYFGQLPISEIKGLSDEIDGGVMTTSFKTAPFCIEDVQKGWQNIDAVSDLAVEPVLSFMLTNHIPLAKVRR